jgi:flagellar hook-basal body complex protein FliE
MENPQLHWKLERMRDGGKNYESTPDIIRKEAGDAFKSLLDNAVNDMRQAMAEATKAKEQAINAKETVDIVADKKETVAQLGKKFSNRPKPNGVKRLFIATKELLKKI